MIQFETLFANVRGSKALVDRLKTAVADGTLAAGSRLPSQRRLAYDLGLAVGTVTRAFQMAEREGVIVSYVGRGSFVAQPGFATNTAYPTRHDGRIDLSIDVPLEGLNPDIAPILLALAGDPTAAQLQSYQEYVGTGRPRHRRAGAQWLSHFGVAIEDAAVTVCAGSQHALFCALAGVCHAGDLVLCEALTFPGFSRAAQMLGLRIEAVAIDAQGMIPAAVEEICKTQSPRLLYVTPSVQNPTNAPLNAARRNSLAQLAARYDFAIVEDVVRPAVGIAMPAPIQTLAPDRTFFIGGVSKTLGGGLRVSFMATPPRWQAATTAALWASQSFPAALPGEIAARLIETGAAANTLTAKAKACRERHDLAERHLGNFDIRLHPVSTFAWLNLPQGWTSAPAIAGIEAAGVAVTPSEAFWCRNTPPPNAIRICLGAATTAEILEEALTRIAGVLSQSPPPFRV